MSDFLRQLPVSEPPKRVVSLVPSVTESLFDLNLGHTLVGRTAYCIYPADKVGRVPIIGGTKNPDIAHIIAMRPDLVIANQEENRKTDVDALQSAGIPVWVTFPKTLQDVFNLLWDIMDTFDEPNMVPRVRLIEQSYDYVLALKATQETPIKTFVPIWYDPLMTFNADTYCHHLLEAVGGTNIFAERERLYPLAADLGQAEPYPADDPRIAERDTRYPRVTLEEVVAAQPDVILLPSEPFQFTEAHLPIFQALDVPAAKHNRIHLVDGSYLTWHGTRIAYALSTFPALFHHRED